MKNKDFIIWDSHTIYDEEWQNEIKTENLELTDEEVWEEVNYMNYMYLEDERTNLNISLDGNIIIIADLGLWNGSKCGYKEIDNNIASCLNADADEAKWYVDKLKDLCCIASHHDGTNYYTYRELKSELSDIQIENFKNKLYNGTVTRKDITRYTNSVGKKVLNCYGV